MKSFLPATVAFLMIVPSAFADPIEDREALMKERSQILRTLGPIAQGNTAFEAETVMAALEELNANAQAHDVDALYPDGSQGGEAADAIWTDREGFVEADEEYRSAVEAAVAAAPQDLAAFRGVFQPIAAGCGACHESYRTD